MDRIEAGQAVPTSDLVRPLPAVDRYLFPPPSNRPTCNVGGIKEGLLEMGLSQKLRDAASWRHIGLV
jgi:hypothetical protein